MGGGSLRPRDTRAPLPSRYASTDAGPSPAPGYPLTLPPLCSVAPADQINVPSTIDEVTRLYTKAVLREQPEEGNLIEWSRAWFEARVAERGTPAHN